MMRRAWLRKAGPASLAVALALMGAAALIGWRFDSDMQLARAHAAQGSMALGNRVGALKIAQRGGQNHQIPAEMIAAA